jgi:hypothetical protein
MTVLSRQVSFLIRPARRWQCASFPASKWRFSACPFIVAGLCLSEQKVEAAENAACHGDQAGEKHDGVCHGALSLQALHGIAEIGA